MFSTLLIANRGEIAVRIARTARAMGVRTIAVFSDADAGAMHVRACDEAARLGPAPARDSYLRGDLILAAAKAHGAQAIHPGYGFLSENPEFAEACAAAGIAFVGPPADAIRAMGLKDRAKAIAAAAGAPVLPGYWQADQSPRVLAQAAQAIGFPLLIKAVAGGGGRGIRRVDEAGGFAAALDSARREAAAAFGDDRVMLEKLVANPRHIEVQVFGDHHGGLVHLFERDCSIQRRRQKLIEEAPAPLVSPPAREALCEAALRIARSVGYANAGTVEFVAEGGGPLQPDGFWFLEMNTRLQVEHPVTEAITGLDLVEWQLRVAAGERLPLRQDEITRCGWAIEARLVAEDAEAGFLPSSGPISHFMTPAGVRVDAGFGSGDTIPDAYDSLLAKVIASGPDRESARAALINALENTAVFGPQTNAGFLARACRAEAFAAGSHDTGFLEAAGQSLARPEGAAAQRLGLAAAAAALSLETEGGDPWGARDGWRLNADPRVTLVFAREGTALPVAVSPGEGRLRTVVEGATGLFERAAFHRERALWRVRRPGESDARVAVEPDGVRVADRGEVYLFSFHQPDIGAEAAEAADEARAPLPGRVIALAVSPGAIVAKGDVLCVVEAMKMEHAVRASRAGVVAEATAAPGTQVRAGDVLVRLAPLGDAA
jgi:3-methylcrotonyl-CoA carboxylase alpha subunit